ncbi:hypothetical protein TrVGV298_002797 [Trichoderma virens]|nr:hypothetical protein TrVGV298_002797 [Trichoderma virens]
MAASRNNYSYDDYTIAWICALPLELAAAEAMLDESHPSLPAKPNDDNVYILGRIHLHNVVIACLPSGIYGTTSATAVATQLRSSFQSIRFFLMVGGVVQYDYGKAISGGRFERTGVLNKPPPVLLSAISKLQATSMSKPNKIYSIITQIMTRNDNMRKAFAHPGEGQDLLFECEYEHPESEENCGNCDKKRLIERSSRVGHDPFIHYGLIASGNQVVKDSRIRDKIVQELDVLCFEMEAAGLMDNFPCLVVRGICDYSDSHKNKQWQNYAAAVAAAYTKELLLAVHANQVSDTPAADLNVSIYAGDTLYRMKPPTDVIVHHNIDETLLERISSYDHNRIHRRLSRKRLVGTTQWFLNHPDFTAWIQGEENFNLWCSGKIGSGKTMIATAVIEAAKYRFSGTQSPTVFFYCDYEHNDGLDASYIVSSLIKQICEFLHKAPGNYPEEIVQDLERFFGSRRIPPDFDNLQDVFAKLFDAAPDTVYIIDGIDALSEEHASQLLKLVQRLFCCPSPAKRSRILLLSRDQIPGYINIHTFIHGIRQISTSKNITQDIETYIETIILDKMMYRKLTDDDELLEEVKKKLLADSSDMFLWVYLQLEILWDTCHTDAEIRSALATLPKGIEETYRHCVARIDFQDKWALKVLKWVSFAKRPLNIEELREAVAFDYTDTEWNGGRRPQIHESLPALHFASKFGYNEIIEILLKFCDVNKVDQHGYAPLHYAARKGNTETTRILLLQKGIKVNVKSNLQCTPLWIAARDGHEGVVSLLVKKRANLRAKDTVRQQSALSCAVKNGHYAIARLLVQKGADIFSRNVNDHSPLGFAIMSENKAMMGLLMMGHVLDKDSLSRWVEDNSFEEIKRRAIRYDKQDQINTRNLKNLTI